MKKSTFIFFLSQQATLWQAVNDEHNCEKNFKHSKFHFTRLLLERCWNVYVPVLFDRWHVHFREWMCSLEFLDWRPGGRDCFSFSAFSLSLMTNVYRNREQRTLNLVLSAFFLILTLIASFLRAFRRKSWNLNGHLKSWELINDSMKPRGMFDSRSTKINTFNLKKTR